MTYQDKKNIQKKTNFGIDNVKNLKKKYTSSGIIGIHILKMHHNKIWRLE